MSYSVKNQIALVTGANRGIGKAITQTLLKHGAAKVYVAVRDLASAKPLIDTYGDRVIPLPIDLSKPETIKQAAQTASNVTLVINNAGVLKTATPLGNNLFASLTFEMEINLFGWIHVAREFVPVLKANGGGALVQLNSVASMKCFPDFASYCASKAASYSVTQALYHQLKDEGITVVSVHPGPIATDMADSAGLTEMAEPAELVGEAIVASLAKGEFHCYPDSMARQIGEAYQCFATDIVEANLMEG